MSKKTEEVKKLFTKQLFLAYDIASVADKQHDVELQEMTSHYIFDLLDWGRRTMKLSDNDVFVDIEPRDGCEELPSVSVRKLEKLVEKKLYN